MSPKESQVKDAQVRGLYAVGGARPCAKSFPMHGFTELESSRVLNLANVGLGL